MVLGPVGRFLAGALFGAGVSLLLLGAVCSFDIEFLLKRPWGHIFWVLPVTWGCLGIFWPGPMMKTARDLANAALGIRD